MQFYADRLCFILQQELLEHMMMKEVACQTSLVGTIVTFGGTLLMVLYKGPGPASILL